MSLAMLQYRFSSLKTSFEIGMMRVGSEALYVKNMARVSLGIKGKDTKKENELVKENVSTKPEVEVVNDSETSIIEKVDGEIIDTGFRIHEISSERVDDNNQLPLVVKRLSADEIEIINPVYDPFFLSDDELDENIEEAYKFVRGEGNLIKMTILSMFYMASMIKPEQLFSRCKNDNDLVIVNSIIKFYSGLPVLPQCDTLSINEVIPVGLLKNIVDFESNYEMVVDNDNLYEVIKKTEELLIAYNKAGVDPGNGEETAIPVFFTARNMNLTGHHGVTKAEINKLEKELGDLLVNYAYQFNKVGDLIEMVIYNDGRMDSYYIDPGVIIGNGFNVICNVPGDTIMVNQKHKDILSKVFENPCYYLNQEEIMRVCKDMFMNPRIYYMVDMTKGPEFLPKLSDEEFAKLGKKLSFILNIPWNPNEIPFGRMRFRGFKSVEDFTLVSDDKCKSPLTGNDETCSFISPSLVVKVNGDKVVIKNETATKEFVITEYAEM